MAARAIAARTLGAVIIERLASWAVASTQVAVQQLRHLLAGHCLLLAYELSKACPPVLSGSAYLAVIELYRLPPVPHLRQDIGHHHTHAVLHLTASETSPQEARRAQRTRAGGTSDRKGTR